MNERQKSGRKAFLLINFLFFGPLAIAIIIYATSGWRPDGSTEKGEFLSPPVTIPDITFQEATDREPRKHLRGVWNVVYAGPGECAELCQSRLVDARQMRLSFGKDAGRVQQVFLVDSGSIDTSYITLEHPKLQVVTAGNATAQLAVLKNYQPGDLYIVDPIGNVILKYRADITIADIKKDLKKLLKLSQIG
ncbi:MAG: hypothetical protein P8R04_03530 [Gammaproteobacteria bacterium]|jgi:hypothetical protein|nr:hypothetical protein [Gammaproteobacteria bacterium]